MRPCVHRATALLALLVLACPMVARAASVVFDGDPIDPGTGEPYQILPGQPLVTPGPDGYFATADDIVDPGTLGDIDLVLRLGAVTQAGIPDPAKKRNAVFTGVAGPLGIGTPIPFTAYLSDGAVSAAAPYGNLLTAPDMDGHAVIVLLFADRDGDGLIGPSNVKKGKRPENQVRALAELEPVGREVALFSGGIATGSVVVTSGAPLKNKGLTLVGTALAFTGPSDPDFLDGHVPTGPGITTAQPFLPEPDPTRFMTDPGPLEIGGTLNPEPRAAGLPVPGGALDLALPANGSSPTIDTALALAGAPTCARAVDRKPIGKHKVPAVPRALVLGTEGSARKAKLQIVPVDRFGNHTGPGAQALTARVSVDGPLTLKPDRDGDPQRETIELNRAKGKSVKLTATGAGTGTLRVTVGGARCQQFAYASRPERNKRGADAIVGGKRGDFESIAVAVGAAVDTDLDGRITIEVAEGIFRETVLVNRAIELRGSGLGRTVIDAQGLGPALTVQDDDALVDALTASGGTSGISVQNPVTLRDVEAWANLGTGIELTATGATAERCIARANGGDGFRITATATVTDSLSSGNSLAGILVSLATDAVVTDNRLLLNGDDGIVAADANDPIITGNRSGGNFGRGVGISDTVGGLLANNRAAGNHGDGLRVKDSTGMLVDGNDLSGNGGWGMHIRDATADFDAAAGVQSPPGTNDVSDNRLGPVLVE